MDLAHSGYVSPARVDRRQQTVTAAEQGWHDLSSPGRTCRPSPPLVPCAIQPTTSSQVVHAPADNFSTGWSFPLFAVLTDLFEAVCPICRSNRVLRSGPRVLDRASEGDCAARCPPQSSTGWPGWRGGRWAAVTGWAASTLWVTGNHRHTGLPPCRGNVTGTLTRYRNRYLDPLSGRRRFRTTG